MEPGKRIATVIVDDNKEAIFTLQGFLELMPEIEIIGTATHSAKAIKLIKELSPDLVFLDIEMPGKTGFELLNELDKTIPQRHFKVIFHTAYDKYTLQALRESAFDFILKPPRESELKEIIQRFSNQKSISPNSVVQRPNISFSQMAALPTNT
ncbi:MAG: LytR/AlgR family response regulator transcription factor, partial [Bacteroidales bacterium]